MPKLIFPTEFHKDLWLDIVKEFDNAGEKIIPYALTYRQNEFEVFLQKTIESHNSINLGSYVPSSTYFLMDGHRDKILGAVNIRHSLNEQLLFNGGHIGYGIRPNERRKGYATKMLKLALDKCSEMGLKKVLVTCNKDNIGSAKTIINNGGTLENEVTEDNGNIVQRYWIELQ